MKIFFVISVITVFLSGCSISNEVELFAPAEIDVGEKLCIIKNDGKKAELFHEIITAAGNNGFSPTPADADNLDECPLYMDYSVEYGWDLGIVYLNDIQLNLYRKSDLLATAKYHVSGGSFNIQFWSKYRHDKTILNNLFAELKEKIASGQVGKKPITMPEIYDSGLTDDDKAIVNPNLQE